MQSSNLLNNANTFKNLLSAELQKNSEFFMAVTSATGDKTKAQLRHTKVRELIFESLKS